MAFLKCSFGAGGGNNIELVVTCSPAFAGLTITATDGSSTLTKACPLTSPYEVTFELPNFGTWTVSGTIGSKTYSESIIVDAYEVELISNINLNLDVYSAANDTVSYVGVDGQTHTITTDSNGHASATITINSQGSSLTFESSVAKDPSNLSNNYTKTILLDSTTTNIKICPDGTIYWFGYEPMSFQSKDYIRTGQSVTAVAPTITKNTNSVVIALNRQSNTISGTWISDNPMDFTNYTDMKVICHDWIPGTNTGTNGAKFEAALQNQNNYDISSLQSRIVPTTATGSTPVLFSCALDLIAQSSQYPACETMLSASSSSNLSSVTLDAWWVE